ncbi:LCP family protein [Nocardioides conyzicola]|uniref:Cell envelope-related transcriptional attenuator domain-containing protein n=1 Tax=Nocardioides conyzicola TaxID=1651781 RepID=A0ABP8XXS5_9ACTN
MAVTVGAPARAPAPPSGRHRAPAVREFRRARSLGGALGITLLGAALPGAGYLWSGRRLGYAVLLPFLAGIGLTAFYVGDLRRAADLAFDPTRLEVVRVAVGALLLVWVFVVATTYLMVRPRGMQRLEKGLGVLVVSLVCVLVSIPAVQAMRIAGSQADLVRTVFDGEDTATAPDDVTEEDPWGGRQQVNVLLLGGDGGVGRTGIRTDSVILLSMNTTTGRSVMFSLPRNMMNAQFPEDSPLHEVFPDGFRNADGSDPGNWMLNAVYSQVPALYPHILGASENEGADAVKQAVAGSLGTHVDYYVLINLLGFQQLVDAMGGVTVNINEPIAINGNTDAGIPPTGYLQPGPDQHLSGFQALWYSRGRWGSDDYKRMLRQRCMVGALVDAADPLTVLRRYQALASAGKEILRTDVPRTLMPAFVDLAMKVKERPMKSMAFVSSDKFFSGDPDYDWMHDVVDRALAPKKKHAAAPDEAGTPVKTTDACGYHPVQ